MSKPPIKQKYIEDEAAMWLLFQGYLKAITENPIKVQDYVGKDGDMVYRDKQRPLTMEGFRAYGYDNEVTIKNYFDNQNGAYSSYHTICSRIKEIIRANQIEGGMVGIFNPSITQRLNGLTEKTENKNENTNIEIKAEFGVKKD